MKTPHVLVLALVLLAIGAALVDRPPDVRRSVRAGYQFQTSSDAELRADDAIHLVYWEKWNNFEGEAMQACVDAFNAHSRDALTNSAADYRRRFLSPNGQRIIVHLLSTTQVNRKTQMAVSGGVPPDIAGLWSRDVQVFAEFNAALPLDEFIARDGPSPAEYQKCYWDMCVYEGKVWALPTTPSTIAMYWNKELFEQASLNPDQPPKTLAELDEFNSKLTKMDKKTGRLVQMGFHPGEPGWWNYAWGNWFGGPHATPDGRTLLLDSKEWVASYTWLNKLARDYGRNEMRTFKGGMGTFDSPQNAFIAGKVAIVLQGVWMANYIRTYNQSLRWGVAPFPGPGGTAADPVTLAQADVLMIPRGCKHPEEAWTFVRYVNSIGPDEPHAPLEGMEILCFKQGKHSPFIKTTRKFREEHVHESLQCFIDLGNSKNIYIEPMLPMWEELRRTIPATFMDLMSNGGEPGKDPESILKAYVKRMQPKLDRTWERIDRGKLEAKSEK